jgi:hypothetical protein
MMRAVPIVVFLAMCSLAALGDVWEDARESVVTVSLWIGADARNPAAAPNDHVTGCFVSPDGYILTSKRLVEDARRLSVRVADGRDFPAELVAADPDRDLAILKIGFINVPCLRPSKQRRTPERVTPCVPGEPLVPVEVSPELVRSDKGERLALQTRLAPGARGAPVLDESGGIVAILTQGKGAKGQPALAIPIRQAADLLQRAGVGVMVSLDDPDALRPRPAPPPVEPGPAPPPTFLLAAVAILALIVIWLASAILVLGRRLRRRTVQPIFGRRRVPRPARPPAERRVDDDIDIELK